MGVQVTDATLALTKMLDCLLKNGTIGMGYHSENSHSGRTQVLPKCGDWNQCKRYYLKGTRYYLKGTRDAKGFAGHLPSDGRRLESWKTSVQGTKGLCADGDWQTLGSEAKAGELGRGGPPSKRGLNGTWRRSTLDAFYWKGHLECGS